MTDSDEYFEESIELDEDALASIQAIEDHHRAQLSRSPSITWPTREVIATPPPKRLRRTGLAVAATLARTPQTPLPAFKGFQNAFKDITPVIAKSPRMAPERPGIEEQGSTRAKSTTGIDTELNKVADAFVVIGESLCDAGCIEALEELLNFLAMLMPHCLLQTNRSLQLMHLLERITREHITHTEEQAGSRNNDMEKLAMTIVHLMETLYWNLGDEFMKPLQTTSCHFQILETLLLKQSRTVVDRTLRLLTLMATYEFTLRSLIAYMEASIAGPSPSLVERLCKYIIDPSEQNLHTVQQLIVVFTTIRENYDPPSTTLFGTGPLVPSMIICVSRLSKSLWEDDFKALDSPETTKRIMETLYLSTSFLHGLIVVSEQSNYLLPRLMEISHSPGLFNGIIHMFMVTFSRISWADAPDWIHSNCKNIYELTTELATEIMENIVVGPEFDCLWAVWHSDEEADNEDSVAVSMDVE